VTVEFTVVIPARYASTRLPAKPLADIGGLPMVVHVAHRAGESGAKAVIVATDDQRVYDATAQHGVTAQMTKTTHRSGSDRVMEVVDRLRLSDDAIVVNVQGDEPLIPPAAIRQVAERLAQHAEFGVATLCEPIFARSDLFNPNVVKVVRDISGRALYFSRAPIPWWRDEFAQARTSDAPLARGKWMRHIGIYGYRVAPLRRFCELPPSDYETLESLEQLRLLASGVAIAVDETKVTVPGGVDTPEDLKRVRQRLGV
jgi:3-deoxy-manno-octulosonate cytidylyltransferase (CMP-KDO synthetase)